MRLLFPILLIQSLFAYGQTNLVSNYSFEQYINCPNSVSQIHFAVNWFQPNKCCGPGGTSDYFNSCASNVGNDSIADVPNNIAGFQYARTGNGYAGIGFFTDLNGDSLREYIETKLIDSLLQGKKYCVEFYVSLGEKWSNCGIDAIEAFLSKDSVLNNSSWYPYFPVTAQISNSGGMIIDTSNWILISGEFIAGGGERFITIGNFKTNTSTNYTQILGGSILYSYYYIDDVSVTFCDSIPEPPPPLPNDSVIYVPNAFSPNGDGENDLFFVRGDLDELHCYIFNRWGGQVGEIDLPKQGWDGRVNGLECNTGVYFYYLIAKDKNGKEITTKGNVTLLR